MKNWAKGLVCLLALGLVAENGFGQPPEGRRGRQPRGEGAPPEDGRRGEGRPEEGGRVPGGPPRIPLLMALDADRNGELSTEEIENAVAALKSLDRNKDGKLTREELLPEGFGRGPGGPGGFGDRGGRGPEGDAAPGRRGPGIGPERLMQFDANKDGKLQKDELPERMQRILLQADTDKAGALDQDELKAMAQRFGQRGGRPGAGRGPRDGEGDPRPDGGRDERPRRADIECQ